MNPLSLLVLVSASLCLAQEPGSTAEQPSATRRLKELGDVEVEAPQAQVPQNSRFRIWRSDPAPQSNKAWLGVALGEADGGRVEVSEVLRNSPAARAGLRAGDRLVALGDAELETYAALIELLGRRHPGDRVQLEIERTLEVALTRQHREGERYLLGVYLGEPQAEETKDEDRDGVRITRVSPGYPGARAGLAAGDVVLQVNGRDVDSSDGVIEALSGVSEPGRVDVRIARRVDVVLGAAPAETALESTPPPTARRSATPRAPAAPAPHAGQSGVPAGLEEELRALSRELRELREQVARLRAEIDRLRAR